MKKQKTGRLWYLLLVLTCLLSGCGKDAGDFDGSYYEASDIDFQGISNIRYQDGYLYYIKGADLCRRPIDISGDDLGNAPEDIVYSGMNGMIFQDYTVDDEGIYCFSSNPG